MTAIVFLVQETARQWEGGRYGSVKQYTHELSGTEHELYDNAKDEMLAAKQSHGKESGRFDYEIIIREKEATP